MITKAEFVVPESASHARAVQEEMRHRVRLENDFAPINLVAGIDVGYDIANDLAHASIVLMSPKDLKPVEQVQAYEKVVFPYIPGLLSFREIPVILSALRQLNRTPQLLMVDGQGIAHPRRLGIAAHLGALLDMPSIGVAKSLLTGKFDMPGEKKGQRSHLMAGQERIGTVLRSRDKVKPLFISPGHRVDLETSVEITLQCLAGYRLPEPTRIADKFSKCKKETA